jgi:hypothetical protein
MLKHQGVFDGPAQRKFSSSLEDDGCCLVIGVDAIRPQQSVAVCLLLQGARSRALLPSKRVRDDSIVCARLVWFSEMI